MLKRLSRAVLLHENVSEVIVRLGIVRIELQSFLILLDCLLELLLDCVSVSEVAMGAGVCGIQ